MKKLKMITAALLFAAGMISCGSDDSNDNQACESATSLSAVAAQAFDAASDENYPTACEAYKGALQNQIAACGDPSGALQAIINDLGDCTLDSSSGGISVTVGTLVKTFETNITVVTVGTTIQVRAEDGGTANDFIYFEIQQGQTGANVIANFNIHLITKDYTPLPNDEGGNWASNITINSATGINGTFFGYVTSSDNATISLTNGVIDIDL